MFRASHFPTAAGKKNLKTTETLLEACLPPASTTGKPSRGPPGAGREAPAALGPPRPLRSPAATPPGPSRFPPGPQLLRRPNRLPAQPSPPSPRGPRPHVRTGIGVQTTQ